MLTKELELVRVSGERTKDELEDTETAVHELEKQLKQKEWEITDQHNMNRAKVSELEAEIEQLKSSMSKAQHRFEHKHANLDQYAKEKEQALIAAKDASLSVFRLILVWQGVMQFSRGVAQSIVLYLLEYLSQLLFSSVLGQVAVAIGFLTRDTSLIWNTGLYLTGKNVDQYTLC